MALGMAVVLSWAVLPVQPVVISWFAPQPAQTSQAPTRNDVFFPVLWAARDRCPPALPVLMLTDGSGANDLAEYYIYPRRLDTISLNDPFGPGDLDAHSGGCLLYYGRETAQRLDPYRSRLNQIECTGDGCLYWIGR